MIVTEIFKLWGSVFVDNKPADKAIDETDKKGKGLAGTFTSMIGTAAKVGAGILAGVTVAGGAMLKFAIDAGNAADRLLDLNSITGMSTDEIQKWEKVTRVAGVSADAMTNASQKLTKSLDTIEKGGGKGAESLNTLGLSFQDIAGMNADERMDAIAKALAGVEDKTERAKLGTDLMGKSWAEIAPIVDLGTEAMQKAKDSANIISEEDLTKANNFRIRMAEMKDSAGHFAMMLGISVMPLLEGFFSWISGNMPQIQATVSKVFEVIATVISTTVDALTGLTDGFTEHWGIIEPILIGIGAGALTFGIYELAINASALATKAWTLITKGAALAGEALNAVLAFTTSPIGLVIIAIGLLVAAGVYLYKNWDEVKAKALEIWDAIKRFFEDTLDAIKLKFETIFEGIKTYIDIKITRIKEIFDTFSKAFKIDWGEMWEAVKTTAINLWDGIVTGIKGAINLIIIAVNGMVNRIGQGINAAAELLNSLPGVNISPVTMPQIPLLAAGGSVTRPGWAIVGEQGPELLNLNAGAQVRPLDKAAGVTFERGAFDGAFIMDDYGVDRLMDRIFARMGVLGRVV